MRLDLVRRVALIVLTVIAFAADGADERPQVFVQLGHTNSVWAVALSPDGRTLAAGDMSGVVKLWDTGSRQELFSFSPAVAPVTALAYAKDGRHLYVGLTNGWLGIYDVVNGKVAGAWPAIPAGKSVQALALSPDGKLLAIGGLDTTIKVASLEPHGIVAELTGIEDGVWSVAFTPDGKRVLAGDSKALRVWSLETKQQVMAIPATDRVSALAVSADGRSVLAGFGRFMVGNNDPAIRIYDLASGRETGELTGHRGIVNALVLSPDGKQVAAATSRTADIFKESWGGAQPDDTVRIWNLAERRLVAELRGHDLYVTGLAWRADGGVLYSASWDKTLRAWNLPAGTFAVLSGIGITPGYLVPDAGGDVFVAVDQQGGLSRWDLDSGQAQTIAPPPLPAWAQVTAAAGGANGVSVLIQENVEQRAHWRRYAPDGTVKRAELTPDSAWAGEELSAHLRAAEPADRPRLIVGMFTTAVLDPSGTRAYLAVRFFASVTRMVSRIVVWNAETNRVERVLPFTIPGEITAIAVSPDEKLILLGRHERTREELLAPSRYSAELREMSGALLWQADNPAQDNAIAIRSLAFSPGSDLALVGNQFVAQLIDVAQRRTRHTLSGHRKIVSAVGFSPDGKLALTGSADDRVGVWDVASGKVVATLDTHTGTINAAAFTGDMKFIMSSADDQTVRVWRWPGGAPLTISAGLHSGDWITLTPEGYFPGSPGGAEQLGFRYRGRLYPLNQFYDAFYRPDLVRRKLHGENLDAIAPAVLEDALQAPPPDVRVAPLADSAAASVRAQFEIVSSGGGIGEIRVFHNGKLIRSDGEYAVRRLPAAQSLARITPDVVTRALNFAAVDERAARGRPRIERPERLAETIEITPVSGENEISVIAFNRSNTVQSRVHSARFVSSRKMEPPRVFVLTIGIDRFRAGGADVELRYAVKDARDMAVFLRERAPRLDAGVLQPVRVLENERATRAGIMREFERLAREVRPQDVLIVFVASHGVFASGVYSIVTHDYAGELSPGTSIDADELIEASKRIAAQRQLLILDTCHAGGLDRALAGLYDARMTLLARNVGMHTFASADTLQGALDGFEGNGLFTHVLLRGLRTGDADVNGDRTVTVFELGDYARRTVSGLARNIGHQQTPLIIKFGRDLPLMTGY